MSLIDYAPLRYMSVSGIILLLLVTNSGVGHSSSITGQEPETSCLPPDTNPRTYHGVKILLISNMYESILIDGYHNTNQGNGNDTTVTLQQSNKFHLGIFLLWNESTLFVKNILGGWIHSRIEIVDYNGWMSDQYSRQHLKMFGYCGNVTIISYRGGSHPMLCCPSILEKACV
jgi:hypothetical protein